MTGFPIWIMRPLTFASKVDMGELPRGPVEADAFPFHPFLSALLFRHRGAPLLAEAVCGVTLTFPNA
jgi:hypothetical protein